jgi:tRNA (cmo5U34)-methyltransferase
MSDQNPRIIAERCHWSFDAVADQFEGHIEQSVPNYRAGHEIVCRFADFALRDDSLVYEVGCSNGALARRFLDWNRTRTNMRYVGLDVSEKMIDAARRAGEDDIRATYLHADATTFDFEPCTTVIAYYTFQFIHPAYRQALINKIYQALEWGGSLIVFEKVRAADARFQDYAIQVYNDIKQANGFSEQEILNKAQSLKGVLEPFSTEGNLGLMRRAGFQDITTLYKWICFEGWLAIK